MIMQASEKYVQFVLHLKKEIQTARLKASLTANIELLALYWKLGDAILQQQKRAGWGSRIIDRLSADLQIAFPSMKGLSARNLKYMRAFALAFPYFVQLSGTLIKADQIVQQAAAQLPWFHICTILDKTNSTEELQYYTIKTASNNWSRNVLVQQIESKLWQRMGRAVTNFEQTLPTVQSDLAKELMKDPYKFDFLHLYEEYKEKDLESALIDNLTRFLLELGSGFSFIGRQYPVTIGDRDYFIDLLFYHFRLHCFVVVELKTGEFIPEYAGKLNFYLNIVDNTLKQSTDSASIGILICKQRNRIIAEYALRGISNPIGVSEYRLTETLPEDLRDSLPSVEQIESKFRMVEEPVLKT